MADLLRIFHAGFVRRWHTNPDLAHTCDRIDGHSGRVARIILALHPDPSVELIRAALIHDDGESVVGDVSATFKRSMPEHLRMQLAAQEVGYVKYIWGDCHILNLSYPGTIKDAKWLRFADRLDAYMWAAHHAPHVMGGDDWPEACVWLTGEAETLDCILEVRDLMQRMELGRVPVGEGGW